MDLALEVERVLRDEQLLRSGDAVVCAVSGGPDSMALLHVLQRLASKLNMRLVAAHVHHGFRGEESDLEAETTRRFAEKLGVPFEYSRADVPAYARDHGLNAQAAAREVRYRFLMDTAVRHEASVIALAHHRDDQVETILMNLLGGASLTGLSGMQLCREENNMKLIRPFLRIPKKEILAYIVEREIPFCLDSSNEMDKYERNRLRHELLPRLLTFNPNLPSAVSRMAEVLREEDDYVSAQAQELAGRIAVWEEGFCHVSRSLFLAEPVALQRRLIKLILNYLAGDTRFPDFARIESIRTAIERETPPSLSLDIGGSIRFRRVYDRLEWTRSLEGQEEPKSDPAYAYEIWPESGLLELPEAHGLLQVERWAARGETSRLGGTDKNEAWFDADLLQFPLTVRSRRNGDRIEPIGVIGSKKVKDMFIDLKIDPKLRERMPIIVDGAGRILWIAGVRRSRHALLSERTSNVLHLRFETVRR